jgi:hypothetical protein
VVFNGVTCDNYVIKKIVTYKSFSGTVLLEGAYNTYLVADAPFSVFIDR